MRTEWIKGPRSQIVSRDKSGREIIRTGKNGGPVIEQRVEKVISWH